MLQKYKSFTDRVNFMTRQFHDLLISSMFHSYNHTRDHNTKFSGSHCIVQNNIKQMVKKFSMSIKQETIWFDSRLPFPLKYVVRENKRQFKSTLSVVNFPTEKFQSRIYTKKSRVSRVFSVQNPGFWHMLNKKYRD